MFSLPPRSDFDEQTADDWDVDMSVYYDKGMKSLFYICDSYLIEGTVLLTPFPLNLVFFSVFNQFCFNKFAYLKYNRICIQK